MSFDATTRDEIEALVRALQGPAFANDGARDVLVRAWATAAAMGAKRLDVAVSENNPQDASETIESWEDALRVPNDDARSLAERRARLLALLVTGSTFERIVAVFRALQAQNSFVLYGGSTTDAPFGEPEAILARAVRLGAIDFGDADFVRSLALALSRLLPARNLGSISRPGIAPQIVYGAGARWNEAAPVEPSDDVQIDACTLLASSGDGRTYRSPARLRSWGNHSALSAADLNAIQRSILMRAPYDSTLGVGLQNGGIGGHKIVFANPVGASSSVVLDASIDYRDRVVVVVGQLADANNIPGNAGDSLDWSDGAEDFQAIFYGSYQSTVYGSGGRIRFSVDPTFFWLQCAELLGSNVWIRGTIYVSPPLGKRTGPVIAPLGASELATYDGAGLLDQIERASWDRIFEHAAHRKQTNVGWPDTSYRGDGGIARVACVAGVRKGSGGDPPRTFVLDSSADWRDRMLTGNVLLTSEGASTRPGTEDDGTWVALYDTAGADTDSWFSIYTGSGAFGLGESEPFCWRAKVEGIYLYARSSDGALCLALGEDAPLTDDDRFSVIVMASASEALGPRQGAPGASGFDAGFDAGFGGSLAPYGPLPGMTADVAGDPINPLDLNLPQDVALWEQGHAERVRHGTPVRSAAVVDAVPLGPLVSGDPPLSLTFSPRLRNGVVTSVRDEIRQRIAGGISIVQSLAIPAGSTRYLDGSEASPIGDWRDRIVRVAALVSGSDRLPGNAGDVNLNSSLRVFSAFYTGPGYTNGSGYKLDLAAGVSLFAYPDDGSLRIQNTSEATSYVVVVCEATGQTGMR